MDGQILGFNAEEGNGAIRGDNGERYSFAASEWKGTQPPKVGDKVNFVANGAVATEIYPLKTGVNVDFGAIGAKLGDKEARDKLFADVASNQTVTWFLSKPHVIGAALVILGWFIAGHLMLFDWVGDMSKGLGRMPGGIEFLRVLGAWSFLLLYAIPVLAGWLIWKAWTNTETGVVKTYAGWGSIVLPIAVPLLAFILIYAGLPGEIRRLVNEFGRGFDLGELIDIDFGFVLMIGGGVLILLQHFGIVKSFMPKKPDPAGEF